jgi:acyl-CoA thioesterase
VATNRTEPTVSQNANIAFLAPARGEELIATARCVKDGRTTCFYEVDITDESENLLVRVSINGFKLVK